MSVRDIRLASAETLMMGLQVAIANCRDEVVKERCKKDFRRVEKLLGFEPGTWRDTP